MTKKDLILALQKFPDETPIKVGNPGPLVRVEMVVDTGPVAVEASSGGESWQQLLATRISLTLIGGKLP